jgi:hypothetical protein
LTVGIPQVRGRYVFVLGREERQRLALGTR